MIDTHRTLCYPIKHLERLPDLILGILIVRLEGHHHQELREVNHPRAVLVHQVDHVLDGRFGGVLAKRPHDGPDL